jgi:hypothetical protein
MTNFLSGHPGESLLRAHRRNARYDPPIFSDLVAGPPVLLPPPSAAPVDAVVCGCAVVGPDELAMDIGTIVLPASIAGRFAGSQDSGGAPMCPQPAHLLVDDTERLEPQRFLIRPNVPPEPFDLRALCRLCLGSTGRCARARRSQSRGQAGSGRRASDASRDDGGGDDGGGDPPGPPIAHSRLIWAPSTSGRAMTARPLDPQVCDRLIKLLGMTDSKHDGERAAAGLKANKLLRRCGLRWDDVICVPCAESDEQDPPPRSEMPDFDDIDWDDALGLCLARRHQLRDRERAFLESIAEWEGDLTPKQLKWLGDIYARLTRGRR